eukprot:scaffold376486_cov28-Attheya_sp.AAC.1
MEIVHYSLLKLDPRPTQEDYVNTSHYGGCNLNNSRLPTTGLYTKKRTSLHGCVGNKAGRLPEWSPNSNHSQKQIPRLNQ